MIRQVAVWSTTMLCALTLAGFSDAGHRRGSGCCAVAPAFCAPACAPAVQYVERQVTCYRPQMVEQTVTQQVTRCVPTQENFSYTVNVPVMRQEKRAQTVMVAQQKEIQVPVTVCVPVTTNETRTVTQYTPTSRVVEYTYNVMVPETVQRKVLSTTFQCVPKQVSVSVPVCRMVPVQCTDSCGNCYTSCRPVVEYQQCTRTIVERIPTTQEVTVNEVVCRAEARKGQRTVCEMVPSQQQVTVPVTRMTTQQQMVKRVVCEMVPQQQEVMVNVCSFETRQQTGTRTVYRAVTENVTQKVMVCQMVPYTTTVQVAVPCGTGCCQ